MTAIKGYPSQLRVKHKDLNGGREFFPSVCPTDPKNRAGVDVLPKALYFVSAVAKTAETVVESAFPQTKNPKLRIVKFTGAAAAGIQKGDVLRFVYTGSNPSMEVSVESCSGDYIYLSGELSADPDTEDFYHMRHVTLTIDSSGNLSVAPTYLTVVDNVDGNFLDVGVTNIPASASLPQEIVASLASAVKKIQVIDDIGEFIGLYSGSVGAEVFLCVLPQGYTGSILEIDIPAGTRLSVKNMKNSAIATSTVLAINFMG